ncbi:hypothetical protein [Spirosoma sordidisoli]|uniref:Uncharacterized protein n=1 Tax=Spirosoma sordidisoli TaxID=2502893 RepID=A0A4Q2UJD9_9BACT|nr:hypothetical protein [Spirosoma sordidisoli]RYC69597.1 hypothetical protein EQG79_13420 [Spirosoma sordidisoli]
MHDLASVAKIVFQSAASLLLLVLAFWVIDFIFFEVLVAGFLYVAAYNTLLAFATAVLFYRLLWRYYVRASEMAFTYALSGFTYGPLLSGVGVWGLLFNLFYMVHRIWTMQDSYDTWIVLYSVLFSVAAGLLTVSMISDPE